MDWRRKISLSRSFWLTVNISQMYLNWAKATSLLGGFLGNFYSYWLTSNIWKSFRFHISAVRMASTFLPPAFCEGYVFTGVCQSFCSGGGWYPSMPCSRSPVGGGGIPACLAGFQAHTQGGSWGRSGWGGSPGPHPRGSWGGSGQGGSPGPHPGWGWGVYPSMHWGRPPDGNCCRRYASYWNVFLFWIFFYMTSVLLWGHWYPCFGLLVTSALAFRVGSLIRTWPSQGGSPRLHAWSPARNGILYLLSESPAVDLHDDGRASVAPAMRHGTVYTGADRAAPWWQRWHADGRRLTDRWHVCAHRCARSGRFNARRFGTSTCFIQLQLAHFTHIALQTELQEACFQRHLYWAAAYVSQHYLQRQKHTNQVFHIYLSNENFREIRFVLLVKYGRFDVI